MNPKLTCRIFNVRHISIAHYAHGMHLQILLPFLTEAKAKAEWTLKNVNTYRANPVVSANAIASNRNNVI
jgi:hypothetical protein